MFSGSKLGSPVTSGVTLHQIRVYFVACKGILTPILRTWVQKSTLLLQNRGHAEVLKKDPFFREIRNAGAAPLCTWVPLPGHGSTCANRFRKIVCQVRYLGLGHIQYRVPNSLCSLASNAMVIEVYNNHRHKEFHRPCALYYPLFYNFIALRHGRYTIEINKHTYL